VVDSVNWLRNNDVKPEDVNEPTLTALTNLGEQCRRGTLTPTQKKKAIDDAMNWLRNNDPTRPTWTIRQPRGWRTWATHARPSVSGGEGPSG
jgi:hypothetical protein